MGRPAGWMKELTGRSPMKSPGAPSHRREIERAFWVEIAPGLSSENAATTVGVSPVVGARWFRHRGGMSPFVHAPPTLRGRHRYRRVAHLRPRVTGMEGSQQAPPRGPAMGDSVEPIADRRSPPHRLSRRCVHADLPRDHLPSAICSIPWRTDP